MECYHVRERDARHRARPPETAQGPQRRGAGRVHFLTPYRQYFQIMQIIIAIALIISILLQTRGAGLGSVFGGTGTVFKTRRGIDKLLFRMTVAFTVFFAAISVVTAMIPLT